MAKLPGGRYVIVDTSDAYVRGAIVDSMRLRAEIRDGIYPTDTVIQHVLSGQIFRINITPQAVPFKALSPIQKDRAERYRAQHWPNPKHRPRPRRRK